MDTAKQIRQLLDKAEDGSIVPLETLKKLFNQLLDENARCQWTITMLELRITKLEERFIKQMPPQEKGGDGSFLKNKNVSKTNVGRASRLSLQSPTESK